MKFNIYPQEFPALSRYLLRFADGGRFRTSLSAVQSAARDVGELPASLRGAAFRQIAYAPARETQKYRIFAEKRIPMKQPDHRPWKVLNSEYLAHEPWFTVRREAVERAGMMPEEYFLYYEELDWSVRIREAGYRIAYDPRATVFHKESATTGRQSPLRSYYLTRNRLLFARRNRRGAARRLSVVYQLGVALPKSVLTALLHGRRDLAAAVLRGARDFLRHKTGKE